MESLNDLVKLLFSIVIGAFVFVFGHRYWELKRAEREVKRLKRKEEMNEILDQNGSLNFNDLIERESERLKHRKSDES